MTDENTTMEGASLNVSEQRKKELKQLFPGAFTETRNNRGELVETIDFERLKAELGEFSEIYDNRRERYGMDWPGKRDCLRLIQQPSYATLKPCREESVDFDTTENLFIEGDNLEVLKLLQKSYYGKVKMIYIDPPYNTGKEFIYPDNFSESLETYLQYAGLKDSEGRTFSTNTANEGRFHTKWLNMMYPRLYLARNLLREDGVIFISIDDNEVENLRRMCNEIFGEENHITTISWLKKVSPSNDATWFSNDHEYLLVYARSKETWRPNRLPLTEKQKKNYTNPDLDHRGDWNSVAYTCNKTSSERPNLYFPITNPNTGKEIWPKKSAVWKFSKEVVDKHLEEGLIYWGKNGDSDSPRFKKFLSDSQGVVPRSVWRYEDVGHTQMATEVFQSIVPEVKFDTPKPPKLIKQMLQIATSIECIVLDFFAGSGTLAQAVLETNFRDGGNRQSISVQLPEEISSASPNLLTISDVAKERIRRVGFQLRQELEVQLDLVDINDLDLGFKVLKLNQSNFKPWQAPSLDISDKDLIQQMELNVDHIDPNASQEDLLYELLLKAGLKPTEQIRSIELAGYELFNVGEDSLYVYLGNDINQSLIDAVLQACPDEFICLDKAFHGNDQLKANAVKTFATFNLGKEGLDRIEFKTV